ncbi:MAG: autotransporter domain-containing protein [Fusobacterium perfoetens]|uniref:autotransporter domain-containing protein n=1 Tax=Fusobacterium perfoetens TaxID=852 RepID=UPI0023F2B248|nr:autotransporter domain-containing protein [Fusobacterium perfoetens]MCI6152571.1 autotransporter domain-containing protein [Fusobacterium perfoetens]MDY3237579.1 autotransporter domain-containing protein [Fusobacterium perfoetens]
MKDNIEKSLKRWLKRKVKVTLALITTFLITGTISYSSEILFIENGTKDKVNIINNEKYQTIFDKEKNTFENIEKLEGQVIIQNNINILNKGLILATNEISDGGSNGIYFNEKLFLENDGIIKGNYIYNNDYLYLKGNGLSTATWSEEKEILEGNIYNNGSLIGIIDSKNYTGGKGATSNTGNGINIGTLEKKVNFGKIENNGIIIGKCILPDINPDVNTYYNGNGINISIQAGDTDISLEKLINTGLIKGKIELEQIDNRGGWNTINNNGNGLHFETSGAVIVNFFDNKGIINGEVDVRKNFNMKRELGNGIVIQNLISDTLLNNNGIIRGDIISENGQRIENTGNGIYISNIDYEDDNIEVKLGKIFNKGNISGNSNINDTFQFTSGNGIYIISGEKKKEDKWYLGELAPVFIENLGVISGKEKGILIDIRTDSNGLETHFNNSYSNYGIVVGKEPIELSGKYSTKYNPTMDKVADNGIAIKINDNKEVIEVYGANDSIVNLENENYKIMNIIKGSNNNAFDKYFTEDDLTGNSNNLILNGVNKTLVVNKNLELQNSIINSYKTSLILSDNSNFKGKNIIINGGGIREKDSLNIVIEGSSGINNLELIDSIINGDVELNDGDDSLTLAGTQINGNLFGGQGKDNLVFNNSDNSKNMNIFSNIKGFENIEVNGTITLFENSRIEGNNNITINKDGNIIVRIDSTEKNSEGVYNSNALINNTNSSVISNDGGKLSLTLNGLGNGSRIDLGMDVSSLEKNKTIDVTSVYHSIKEIEDNGHIVEIGVKGDLIGEDLKYIQLNKIHKSIISSGQDGVLSGITNDEENGKYHSYLRDIYTGSPYSYSSELSRNSMNLFKESILNKDLNPRLKKWSIYGGLTHIDGGTRDTYFGKNYYGWDVGSSETKNDTKLLGAYVQGEYKHTETFNTGFVLGGINSEANINTGSKLEGDSLYLGAYAKKYLGNIKLTSGLGFQYGNYNSERYSNNYGIATLPNEKYTTDYNDKGINLYGEVRYLYEVDKNISIEPYLSLNYTYIKQDGVLEENKPLAMNIESEDFNYTTAKIGLEANKKIFGENKVHTLTIGATYERFLDGADEKYIRAKMRENGSYFDLLVTKKAENIFGFNAKYQLEKENGFMFDLSGNYVFEKQNHTASGEHKLESQWILGVGIGYKF